MSAKTFMLSVYVCDAFALFQMSALSELEIQVSMLFGCQLLQLTYDSNRISAGFS